MQTMRQVAGIGMLTAAAWLAAAGSAGAQTGPGVRVGFSHVPDQFVIGAHVVSAPIADHLTVRPNVEVGFGHDLIFGNVNVDLAYQIPIDNQPWSVYVGGGPSLIFRNVTGNRFGGGGNVLIGLEHRNGFFVEFKGGLGDSANFKVMVGYTAK